MSWKKLVLVQVAICLLPLAHLGKVGAESKLWEYVTWDISPTIGSFQDIIFVDKNTIVGAKQNFNYQTREDEGWDLYLSTDAGKTWNKKLEKLPPIQKIRFFNCQIGFAIGYDYDVVVDKGTIYLGKTVDGGHTWTDLSANLNQSGYPSNERPYEGLYELWIIDSNTIYVASDYQVYRSLDGGINWSQAGDISAINPDFSIRNYPITGNLHFVNSSVGFVCSLNYLFRTNDGGSSWQRLQAPWNKNEGIWALQFLDDKNGWALAVDYTTSFSSPGSGAFLYRTTDGGQSWSLLYKWEGDTYPKTMHVRSATDIWLGGLGMQEGIWHSSDGGKTWTMELEWEFDLHKIIEFQKVGSELRAIASNVIGTVIGSYYKYSGPSTILPDICCNMVGGASVNNAPFSKEVTIGQADCVNIEASIKSSVTGTGDIYVVAYWQGLYLFKIGDPDQWWAWDGVTLPPYRKGVSLSGYALDIYSGLLTGLKGDLLVFVAYWKQGETKPIISAPLTIHIQ